MALLWFSKKLSEWLRIHVLETNSTMVFLEPPQESSHLEATSQLALATPAREVSSVLNTRYASEVSQKLFFEPRAFMVFLKPNYESSENVTCAHG